MINKDLCQEVLQQALSTGGDFAEIFCESTYNNAYEMTSGKTTKVTSSHTYGLSLRILKGFLEVNGYTNNLSKASLLDLANKLSATFNASPLGINVHLEEATIVNFNPIIRKPSGLTNDQKLHYLTKAYEAVKDFSSEITQVIGNIRDEEQSVVIANSLGRFVKDFRSHIFMNLSVVVSDGKSTQTQTDNIGGHQGYELFDNTNIEAFSKSVANSALTMLHAEEMVGGKMAVVVHNAFGGVLLHEACVHALEATTVAKGSSVFCNKLGTKVASDIVTAIDDGTIPNAWGSLNVDDEGEPTKRNVLIEKGILKSYLVDYRNSRLMKHHLTGSSRRQNYRFGTTSRMTNTFFAPGESTFEEIISKTSYGLFAKKMGGGSVNPSTGEFNFAVNEGYLIENGKITKPVRGATLVGSGSQVLLNIDMIADNLAFGHGMCGSASGSIPTDVGQPTIRVQNMTVGGRGAK